MEKCSKCRAACAVAGSDDARWSSSVRQARRDALAAARAMVPRGGDTHA